MKPEKKEQTLEKKLIRAAAGVLLATMSLFALLYMIFMTVFSLERFESSFSFASLQAIDTMNFKAMKINDSIDTLAFDTDLVAIFSEESTSEIETVSNYFTVLEPKITNILKLEDGISQITFYLKGEFPPFGNMVRDLEESNIVPYAENIKHWIYEPDGVSVYQNLVNTSSLDVYGVLCFKLKENYLYTSEQENIFSRLIFYPDDRNGHALIGEIPNTAVAGHSNITYGGGESSVVLDLDSAGWRVLFAQSTATLLQNILFQAILLVLIILAVSALFIVMFAAWFRKITKKIRYLRQLMMQADAGNLTQEVVVEGNDDISKLIECYAAMMQRLNVSLDENYRTKLRLRDAEFTALQAQISPHFLYNTLSLIKWKSYELGAKDISKVVDSLTTFYRTGLSNGRSIVSVSDEIRNIKAYIDLQLTMHDNSFEVNYDYDEALLDYYMPKLVLQPIVENAIVHGVDLLEGKGLLFISLKEEGNDLLFEIVDNGVGIDLNKLKLEKSKGYGINNVNERLQCIYGEGYGVSFQRLAQGTLASIRIAKKAAFDLN